MFNYKLTKTKIKTGLQCHKKLWYDINNRIKPTHHTLHIGNRFGEYIKTFYGNGPKHRKLLIRIKMHPIESMLNLLI
jgi:hypothetical protein